MATFRALRGVCIGPGKNLAPGETAELDAATAHFLVSIKAVEEFVAAPEPETVAPAKAGKEK